MTQLTCRTILIAFIVCMSMPAWSQQYLLYSPKPVPAGQKATSQDDILVKEIKIHKGDTLYGLSRKYNGQGQYFPQILLFNSIKNPDLIYAGKVLKVPLAKKSGHSSNRIGAKSAGTTHETDARRDSDSSPKSETPQSTVSKSVSDRSSNELKSADREKINSSTEPQALTPPASLPAAKSNVTPDVTSSKATSGQKLFEAAAKAYRQDDCKSALELLDLYLKDNSNSPLAADANLYKADCYLKLSAQ